MKKKFLLLPLLMFLLVSCDPVVDPTDSTGDPTATDTGSGNSTDTSSDTTTDPDPDEKDEIDPAELNAAVGFDVYALLPPIYSEDYEVTDDASAQYPIDVYLDLFDWTEDDVDDYDDEMELMLEYVGEGNYEIVENLYIFVDYDDIGAYINIYSPAEAAEKDEIDPAELNAAVGFDVYALLPPIYSDDYEVTDDASAQYPIDVFLDLYDWSLDDALDYDEEMELMLEYVDEGNYEIDENLYIYVAYDGGAYINIYSPAEAEEKEEIGSSYISALNAYFDQDVYSLLPKIYSNQPQVHDFSTATIIDIAVICWDWDYDDAMAYLTELGSMSYTYDGNEQAYVIEENLYVAIAMINQVYYAVEVFSYVDGGVPTPKDEIDAATIAEFNAYFDQDVYAMIPKIYSDDCSVLEWNKGSVIDVGVTCWDWKLADAAAYNEALDDMLVYDDVEEAYILDDVISMSKLLS